MSNQLAGQTGRRADVRANNLESVQSFIIERCQVAAYFGEHHKDIRAAYVDWCEASDVMPVTELTFCKALIALGYAERSSRLSRGWGGLRLI